MFNQSYAIRLDDDTRQFNRGGLQLDTQIGGTAGPHRNALYHDRLVTDSLGTHVPLARWHRANYEATARIGDRAVRQTDNAHFDADQWLL